MLEGETKEEEEWEGRRKKKGGQEVTRGGRERGKKEREGKVGRGMREGRGN